MGLKECIIVFDNPHNTYYAGQTVNGRVEINLDAPKKIRGILIKFKGDSNVEWSIHESKRDNEGKSNTEITNLFGSEEYFRIQYYCIGGKEGNPIELPPGKHVYPFTCALPPSLPSSFEGNYGYVRYTVKVVLDRPWKFDQESKTAFTVISPFDLNMNASLREPVTRTLEKFFCCCWCKSGPLTCVLKLAKTGFVSGETIHVIIEVDNMSNCEVDSVILQLKKVISYYSQSPRRETKKEEIVLEKLEVGPVLAHGSKTWNQPLVLPPLPPSNLINCSIIDVDYKLFIELCVPTFHCNKDDVIPITIGTVPLAGSYTVPPTAPTGNQIGGNNPSAPLLGWVGNQGGIGYPYPPATTFGQSNFGAQSIQDKDDNMYTRYASNNAHPYNPMYPVYNFNSPIRN